MPRTVICVSPTIGTHHQHGGGGGMERTRMSTYEFGERFPSGVTLGCAAPSSRTTGALDDVA